MRLKIILMGTGEFAVPPFRALLESEHQVVAVLTQPDKSGRGHHQHVNLVKELASDRGVPVLQPERVNRPEVLETLRSFQADVFIVAAYGQILKPELLAIPRLGAFNLHGSLLPRHRGAAPVQYSIWSGDTQTGVTIFQIEPALDSGPMAGKVVTAIGDTETSGQLMLRLADLSVPLTLQVVRQLADGSVTFEPQDVTQVTLAPKIPREAGNIDWSHSRHQIDCQVRALQPWPKASSTLLRNGQPPLRCIIQQVCPTPDTAPDQTPSDVGSVTEFAGRLFVATGDGWLETLRLQPDGRKSTDGRSFVNGYPIQAGDRFAPV